MRSGGIILVVLLVASFIAPANALAADVLPTNYATVLDFDKVHQALDYTTGGMVSSGGDFWIADRTSGALAHNWEGGGNTEGIIDMGVVKFDDVSEAPAAGYQTDVIALEGHTYVTSSPIKGRYGKFYIEDILRAAEYPGMAATQFSVKYTYQPDGSRNLKTAASQPQAVQPAVAQPATTGGTYSGATTSAGGGVYENYRGSPDIGGDVRLNYWHAQTFTAQSDHQVNAVRLMAYRIGSPGALIVSLRATDSAGHPAGSDLASGSTGGNTLPLSQAGEWREITLSQPVYLTAGMRYAIVARAPGGGGGNTVKWLTDTSAPDYTGGNRESSGDSGASWQSDLKSDYLFEILGPLSGSNQTGAGAGGGQSGSTSSLTGITSSGGGQSPGTTAATGWDTSSGTGGNLPPGVWVPWSSATSQWVTIGPEQICIDTTSNGYDMGAKTQRTYGTNTDYVVEFDFKTTTNNVNGVRLWQDGFAFVWLSWGSTIVLYSGNYDSHEATKMQLTANRWYRIRIAVTKDDNPGYGKYDVYVDGQYVGSMRSSEFDMIRECGGNCILIGKFSESILDRVSACWENIYVNTGGNASGGTGTGSYTGADTDTVPGAGSTTATTTPASTSTSVSTGTTATTGTRLVAESRTASPGDTVLLPVKLENAQGIGSLGYSVLYDPAVIEFVKVDKGAAIPADASFVPNSPQPGTVIIAYATSGAINGNGTAAQLEFKAVGSQGSQSAVNLSEISATGTTGGQIDISPVGGQVTIGQKIKGDGTGDGQVTVLDALMALKMYVKAIAENPVLDVNNDGKVTPEDARQILKMAKPK
jgi:hypothetical protein